jgi:hypothetical protein
LDIVGPMRYLAPMSFLYPSFLWALGALSIPILIHLFNFRKTTRVLFSSTRFLKHVKEITVARRKLKHYLILAARLLFLFFLVMAFAQPLIPASEQISANHNMVIYLDNSQSMSAQAGEKTRGLDAAINMASSIIETFPPDAHYKLITNDFAPFSNAFKTKGETLDLLTQLRLSPVSRTFAEINDRIKQDGTKATEIFWISDLQKSTLGPLPTAWDSLSRLHLVPVSINKTANVFVDSAWLENPFAAGGEKNVLTVKMQNDGDTDVEQLNLKLTINGIQSAATSVNIPKKGYREANFDLTTGLSGLNEGKVSFNDFPVSFDNDFYLSLNFTDKINIIEIKNSAQPTAIQRVFGNKEVFNYQGFPETNFNYSLLETADLVVVNGLRQIDQSLSAALRGYLGKYGVVLLIPAVNPDIDSYQRFAGITMQLQKESIPDDLDKPDFNDPFFENVFEERSVSLAMPKAAPYVQWGGDRGALLRFKNDVPFLSSFQQGGKLFLLASPLQHEYTDFHNHALFVPVMYRVAASGRKDAKRLYYTLKENFISIKGDSLSGDDPLKLVGEQEIVPSQRKVGNRVLFDVPKFSINQGFYRVMNKRDTVELLAFNLLKSESLMEQFTGSEIKKMMGDAPNISIFEAGSAETFSNEIKARYLGKPLWKYALILALVFLLAEVLLIRFLK